MRNREGIQRIGTVRRLRQIREKVSGRAVTEARAALVSAEKRIAAIDEDCRRLRTEISRALVEGTRSTEVAEYHLAWMKRKKQRTVAEAAARECGERLKDAVREYLRSRIERKRMEAWETAAIDNLRREEEHAEAVATDDITVIRHGWQKGA